MIKKSTGLIALFIFFLSVNELKAQGCSDAGVCTMRSIKDNSGSLKLDKKNKNDLTIGFGYGIGEEATQNYTGYLEYTRRVSSKTSLTGKFNYTSISGELANTSGPGDLFLSINQTLGEKKKWQKSFVLGFKVPLNSSAIMKNGIQLPMPYQTSIGTFDLLMALNYSRKSFGATIALQQPLSSTNKNKFLPGDYPSIPAASNYWPTNEFSRKGDLVGRVSYSLKTGERASIRPSLLGIYHLGDDTYINAAKISTAILNSKGLTLNGNIFFDYRLKNGNGFEFGFGAPFIVRDQRPDGLTRSLVISLGYQFGF